MIKKIIVPFKRIRKAMPKFYHGKSMGFAYKARAVGWRRMPPLSLFPYLTGDEIQIHLSIKPLFAGEEWKQGTIEIDPPDLSTDGSQIRLSDYAFTFDDRWIIES